MSKDFKKFLTESELKLDPSMRVGDILRLNINAKEIVEMRITNIEDGKITVEAAKPDYLDFDKDGDKDEPMKKALKDKEEDKVEEAAKPDYLDFDKDGNKDEPMKKALKDKEEINENNLSPNDKVHIDHYGSKLIGTVQKIEGDKVHVRVGNKQLVYGKHLVKKVGGDKEEDKVEESLYSKFIKRLRAKSELKDLDADNAEEREAGLAYIPYERRAARLHNVLHPNKPKRSLPSMDGNFGKYRLAKDVEEGQHADSELQDIVDSLAKDVADFNAGGDMSDALYQSLFDYYFNRGEMPYGTAKARDGDPMNWISDRFQSDLDNMGYGAQNSQIDEILKLSGVKPVKEDDTIEEGFKVGDMVRLTNPLANPGYEVVGKDATHYMVKMKDGRTGRFPKERIHRVNQIGGNKYSEPKINESKPGLFDTILKNAGLKPVTEADLNGKRRQKNKISEGTMAHGIFDRNPHEAQNAINELETLLSGSEPLTKEIAGKKLYGLVFDDHLFDLIDDVDPDMDIRKHMSTMERLEELLQAAKDDITQSGATNSFEINEGKIVVDNQSYDLTLNNAKRTWTANVWTTKKVF